jgi:hypothetical protein
MNNDFDNFAQLPVELQRESIREGEARLEAQLHVAAAADQRALTWGGILIAAVTAALGGGIALATKERPDYALAFLAIIFAGALTLAAWGALSTTRPEKFHLPGNRPVNWMPDESTRNLREQVTLARARGEQAECLDEAIATNAIRAEKRALALLRSYRIAKCTIAMAGILLLLVLLVRVSQWPSFAVEFLNQRDCADVSNTRFLLSPRDHSASNESSDCRGSPV